MRRDALAELLKNPQASDREELLRYAVLDKSFSSQDRSSALNALAKINPQAAESVLRKILHESPRGAFTPTACLFIGQHNFKSLEADLLLLISENRPLLPGEDPPQSRLAALEALDSLNPDLTLPAVLQRYLLTDSPDAALKAELWGEYVASVGTKNAQKWLQSINPPLGMMHDLKQAASDLGVIPYSLDEIIWLETLLQEEQSTWQKWRSLLHSSAVKSSGVIALHNLPSLEFASASSAHYTDLPREKLAGILHDRLENRQHEDPQKSPLPTMETVLRGCNVPSALPRIELITVLTIDDSLRRSDVGNDLFAQLKADFADESSEYGGLLIFRQTGENKTPVPVVVPFPAAKGSSLGDVAFRPPGSMIRESYTALVQYHFHAQARNNADYAGPGRGDLRYAVRTGFACIVLTPVGSHRLNVDYFSRLADGRLCVIDLGML